MLQNTDSDTVELDGSFVYSSMQYIRQNQTGKSPRCVTGNGHFPIRTFPRMHVDKLDIPWTFPRRRVGHFSVLIEAPLSL